MHDLGSKVDQNTEAMRSETSLFPDDLAPEMIAFELTLVDIELFNILAFSNKFILHKKLDIELEMLVFLDAVLNIFVNPCNCEFNFLEIAKDFNNRSILLFLDQAWGDLPSATLHGLEGCIRFMVVFWCSKLVLWILFTHFSMINLSKRNLRLLTVSRLAHCHSTGVSIWDLDSESTRFILIL